MQCLWQFQSEAVCFGVVRSLQFNITTRLTCGSINICEQLIENTMIMNADVLLPV